MATSKESNESTATKSGPKADARNPSGASEEQLRAGENVGKVRGPDIDPSFHRYEFTDAYTGEPVETHQVIHDVPVGVNEDGSLETKKGDDVFFMKDDKGEKPAKGADSKQSQGANQGEAGETKTGGTTR